MVDAVDIILHVFVARERRSLARLKTKDS